tara:strand:- start:497 stop:790 length:294 start_codon:yes stop_codon:yes gene_type:complete
MKKDLVNKEKGIITDDTGVDRSKITKLIKIQYVIKTLRLLIIMVYVSFLFGMLWYIFCDFNQIVQDKKNLDPEEDDPADFENFLSYFSIKELSSTAD